MGNPTQAFRANYVPQLIQEWQIKSLWNKNEWIFRNSYFVQKNFFSHLCFVSICRVLNKYSEYIYFYIAKTFLTHFFAFLKKLLEAFTVSLMAMKKLDWRFSLLFWSSCYIKAKKQDRTDISIFVVLAVQ